MRWAVTSNTALVPFREALSAGNIDKPGIDFTTETPKHKEDTAKVPVRFALS